MQQLEFEQDYFCAYCEEFFTPGYGRDVEHFNPTLKKTNQDNYNNWFSGSTRFNRKKGSTARWNKYQPLIAPTDKDLETRLIYKNGHYIASNSGDKEAENLRDFVFLNDYGLPVARIAYINSLKYLLLNAFNNDPASLLAFLSANKKEIRYRTAIKAEFGFIL